MQSLAWSPDGKQIATGAFRRVVIWNAESLTVEREITTGLTDRIAALRFSPDGQQLIVADGRVAENGTVRIVDVGGANVGQQFAIRHRARVRVARGRASFARPRALRAGGATPSVAR